MAGFEYDVFFSAIEASLAGKEVASWLSISEGILKSASTLTLGWAVNDGLGV